MKYYKDSNKQVYAYEEDGSQDAFIKEGFIRITEDEMKELTKPTAEQVAYSNQSTIKSLVTEATLEIDLLQDAIDADEAEEGDDEKLKNWRKYRVLLRKVDTSVENMELPEKPSN